MVYSTKHLHLLKHRDHGFEFHSMHGCLHFFCVHKIHNFRILDVNRPCERSAHTQAAGSNNSGCRQDLLTIVSLSSFLQKFSLRKVVKPVFCIFLMLDVVAELYLKQSS
jgi:hypothetical protein